MAIFSKKSTGSYNKSTGVYTSPTGAKMSMDASNVPKGTTVTSGKSLVVQGGKLKVVPTDQYTGYVYHWSNAQPSKSTSSSVSTKQTVSPAISYTKEQQKEIAETQKQISKEQKYNKIKSAYDKTIGRVVSSVEKALLSDVSTKMKSEQSKKIGEYGIETRYSSDKTGQGTKIRNDITLTEEELRAYGYHGDAVTIGREIVKLNNKIEQKRQEIEKNAEASIDKYANGRVDHWNKKIESGQITEAEANKKLQKEITNAIELETKSSENKFKNFVYPKLSSFDKKIAKVDKDFARIRAKQEVAQRFLVGATIGGALTLMGPVGYAVGGVMLGRTLMETKNIAKSIMKDPLRVAYETVPMIVGGFVGAKVGGIGKHYIKGGSGNVHLASKISKIPKTLKMTGLVEYMRFMKSLPLSKIRQIIGKKGSIKVKLPGGRVVISRMGGKGVIKAVRTGKNWNENIIVGVDGVVRGTVTRYFRYFGKKTEFQIKYTILKNGQRTTQYIRGGKVFAVNKDFVVPEIALTEKANILMRKGKANLKLANKRAGHFDYKVQLKGQKIKPAVKSKYNVSGKVRHLRSQYQISVAEPFKIKRLLTIAKKSGNKVDAKFLEALLKEKRIKFGKGGGKPTDYLTHEGSFTKITPRTIARGDSFKLLESPDVRTVVRHNAGTMFKAKYTRNPNVFIRAIKQLDRALLTQSIKDGKVYVFTDPVSMALSRVKLPQLMVKTKALPSIKANLKYSNLMSVPAEISTNQLSYLISIGAVSLKEVSALWENEDNFDLRYEMFNLTKLQSRLRSLLKTRLKQKELQKVLSKTTTLPLDTTQQIDVKTKRTGFPNINVPVINTPSLLMEESALRMNANQKFNKELFKQMKYNDPLQALTGRARYSDTKNLMMTKRYGNFYS